ncbi:MAG TPA: SAM-dependent methyltransferase [Bacteroidia bacterium]|jgi:16S rRNA (cytidine1402-2'-O)-methyltransferase|nr:SAM-dependent methyltransferase [Bacteroidia bacterium]
MKSGKLFLIPVTLGEDDDPSKVLSAESLNIIHSLNEFIVENEKSARNFLKRSGTKVAMQDLILHPMGKHVDLSQAGKYLDSALHGKNIGLLSEAGCPGIADPGAEIVKHAHEKKIPVVPIVGPSSLLMALMASGLNGQHFQFHGYLPIDKGERIRFLKNAERNIRSSHCTQLFIETPFRNNQLLEDILKTVDGSIRLCIACEITMSSEYIRTLKISDWKKTSLPDLHKRPAVFLLGE